MGHSLGAGIAALLALQLRAADPRFSDTRCVAVSPPGGTLSEDLARETRSFTLSLVLVRSFLIPPYAMGPPMGVDGHPWASMGIHEHPCPSSILDATLTLSDAHRHPIDVPSASIDAPSMLINAPSTFIDARRCYAIAVSNG